MNRSKTKPTKKTRLVRTTVRPLSPTEAAQVAAGGGIGPKSDTMQQTGPVPAESQQTGPAF